MYDMTKLFSDRSAFIFELSKATPAGYGSVFGIFNYNLHVCMIALYIELECIRRSEFKLYTFSARIVFCLLHQCSMYDTEICVLQL